MRWLIIAIILGLLPLSTHSQDTEINIDEVKICSDSSKTLECQPLSCMEICLNDPLTDPLECPSYCNLDA